MTFMRKFIDVLNMNNWKAEDDSQKQFDSKEKEQIISFLQLKIDHINKLIDLARNSDNDSDFNKKISEIKLLLYDLLDKEDQDKISNNSDDTYKKYYDNIRKQRESNLNISYEDIKIYDTKPFNLKELFVCDGNFTAIELYGNNLEIAYEYLEEINSLLFPYNNLYEDAKFPEIIDIEYKANSKLPISHLRLIPYTATMRKSKYPLCLWLSNIGEYGTEYIYSIYFDREGNIGQCELSLHGSFGIGISYETKIRRNEYGLYILRISKTLYSPPYGTTTIYHCRDVKGNLAPQENKNNQNTNLKPKSKRMSEYEIEQFAKECNAYTIREERKE